MKVDRSANTARRAETLGSTVREVGDDEPVADIQFILSQQMTVPSVPGTGYQIRA